MLMGLTEKLRDIGDTRKTAILNELKRLIIWLERAHWKRKTTHSMSRGRVWMSPKNMEWATLKNT